MSLGTPEIALKIVDLDTTLNSMRCRNHYWPFHPAEKTTLMRHQRDPKSSLSLSVESDCEKKQTLYVQLHFPLPDLLSLTDYRGIIKDIFCRGHRSQWFGMREISKKGMPLELISDHIT